MSLKRRAGWAGHMVSAKVQGWERGGFVEDTVAHLWSRRCVLESNGIQLVGILQPTQGHKSENLAWDTYHGLCPGTSRLLSGLPMNSQIVPLDEDPLPALATMIFWFSKLWGSYFWLKVQWETENQGHKEQTGKCLIIFSSTVETPWNSLNQKKEVWVVPHGDSFPPRTHCPGVVGLEEIQLTCISFLFCCTCFR